MFDGAAENNNTTTTTATSHHQTPHAHHHRRFVSSHPLNFLGGAAATSPAFPGFDAPFHHHHQQLPLHHRPAPKDERIGEAHGGDGFLPAAAPNNLLELERDATAAHPWSNEEVGALLKIGSSIENWFPDFTWDHVSRKLAELGFKRSAEKCRGKFEEESRYFNPINTCSAVKNTSNQTFFIDDLEDLYHGPTPTAAHETQQRSPPKSVQNARDYQHYDGEGEKEQQEEDEQQRQQQLQNLKSESNSNNKNKRKRSTQNRYDEMLKGLCENVVRVMMARQEEMHKKLLEDMVRRDEEKLAREEAWKKQEMERLDEVVEMRAQEQAVAGTRQSTIIQLLNKFTHSTHNNSIVSNDDYQDLLLNATTSSPSSSLVTKAYYNKPLDHAPTTSNPNTSTAQKSVDLGMPASSSSPKLALAPRNHTTPQPQNPGSDQGDEQGKRWPREEVLSLINLRCSVHSNVGGDQESKEGAVTAKVPLWERVSQKMWELGYKRSAKRCKEKWENINKYFRKTKDNIHKKRSLDSRTCPYFHQLSTLYGGGTSQGKGPLGIGGSPEQRSTAAPSENGPEGSFRAGSSSSTNTDDDVGHVHGGGGSSEKGMAHLSVFDFEF